MAIDALFWLKDLNFVHVAPGTKHLIVAGGTKHAIFYQGYDIHVVRNSIGTGDLRKYLFVSNDVDGKLWRLIDALDLGTVTKAEFIPILEGGSTFNSLDGAGPFAGPTFAPPLKPLFAINNITVNTYSGEVIAAPSAAANYLKNFNFVIVARITVGAAVYETAVRVHVHEDVTSAWITPNTLTVRENDVARCSMYAEFSNGLVADVSLHPNITWVPPALVVLTTDDGGLSNGEFTVGAGAANDPISATVAATSQINNVAKTLVPAAGALIVNDAWNKIPVPPTRPKATLIGGPGLAKKGEFPNLLIISEGFLPANSADFELIAADIYGKFLDPSGHPWSILRDSMNFYHMFLPSAESGVTILNEYVEIDQVRIGVPANNLVAGVLTETITTRQWSINEYISRADQFFRGLSIPGMMPFSVKLKTPAEPLSTAPIVAALNLAGLVGVVRRTQYDLDIKSKLDLRYYWTTKRVPVAGVEKTLSQLISKVGYPTQSDKGETLIDLLNLKWKVIYDSGLSLAMVPDDLFAYWISMADRGLIDEVDSALGTALGVKPYESYNTFKKSNRWFTPDVAGAKTGEEIANRARIGIERGPTLHRTSRRELDVLLENLSLTDGVDTVSAAKDFIYDAPNFGKDFDFILIIGNHTRRGGVRIKNRINSDRSNGIAVNLEGNTNLDLTAGVGNRKSITAQAPGVVCPPKVYGIISHELGHGLALDDEYGNNTGNYNKVLNAINVQERSKILDGGGDISGNLLGWRWIRIANAGVTKLNPVISGANYLLKMTDNHAAGFAIGDKVYLRKRGLIAKDDVAVQIDGEFSDELTIVLNNEPANEITVSGLNAAQAAIFTATSVLVKLVEAQPKGIGTITVVGTTVTGVGTYFEAQVNNAMEGGSYIVIGADKRLVASVTDNENLILDSAFPANHAGIPFEIIPEGKYAELLNHAVRKTININKRSLTANILTGDCEADPEDVLGSKIQEPKLENLQINGVDLYSLMTPRIVPVNIKHVVALYDGGDEFLCEVVHPTGSCNMRNPSGGSGFCQVCRYIMVDKIDPSKHNVGVENYANNNYPEI